jgi:hypothetical protein
MAMAGDPTGSDVNDGMNTDGGFTNSSTTGDENGGYGGIGGDDGSDGGDAGGGGSEAGGNSDGGASGGDGANGGGGDNGGGWAQGGPVTANRLSGPNPAGPDDGYGALDAGEFVIRAPEVARYAAILQAINNGTYNPGDPMSATIGPAATGYDPRTATMQPGRPINIGALDPAQGDPNATRQSVSSVYGGNSDPTTDRDEDYGPGMSDSIAPTPFGGAGDPAPGAGGMGGPGDLDDGSFDDFGGGDFGGDQGSPLMPADAGNSLTPDDMMMRMSTLDPATRQALASSLSDPAMSGALLTLLGPSFAPVLQGLSAGGPMAASSAGPMPPPAMPGMPGAPPPGGMPGAAPGMPPRPVSGLNGLMA